jgi:ATP-dependent Clp protease ATP-binding subunit ClpA
LSRAGLKKRSRPTGCYIFTGSTGVGKTELAKQLARFCNMTLIKFDMSECSESHSISKLIGSPPGYTGFDQGGLLTEEVDKYPYSVVLLDEIEKAHPEILNLLLQIMDEGTLSDSTGKPINFNHTIIILTTNLGCEVSAKKPIGFLGNKNEEIQSNLDSVYQIFSPELRSRLDNIIIFNSLNPKMISMIINKNLDELAKQLAEHKITLSTS